MPTFRQQNAFFASLCTSWHENFLKTLFTAGLLLTLALGARTAGAGIEMDADDQFAYAERLFSQEDFLPAADEYRRFAHFFPDDPRAVRARFQIGASYAAAGRFKAAVRAFKRLAGSPVPAADVWRAYFRISECYLALGEAGSALMTLHNLTALADDPAVVDEAYYRIGWIHLESASYDKAVENFQRIRPENRRRYPLELLETSLNRGPERVKNPTAAGVLSILPGAGYAYCGRYQDALIAFLLNGGLIYAAYEAFDNELYALGAVITFVEFGFYAGNIYGAVASAHKVNRRHEQQFIQNLKQRATISLSGNSALKGIDLTLRWSF